MRNMVVAEATTAPMQILRRLQNMIARRHCTIIEHRRKLEINKRITDDSFQQTNLASCGSAELYNHGWSVKLSHVSSALFRKQNETQMSVTLISNQKCVQRVAVAIGQLLVQRTMKAVAPHCVTLQHIRPHSAHTSHGEFQFNEYSIKACRSSLVSTSPFAC